MVDRRVEVACGWTAERKAIADVDRDVEYKRIARYEVWLLDDSSEQST